MQLIVTFEDHRGFSSVDEAVPDETEITSVSLDGNQMRLLDIDGKVVARATLSFDNGSLLWHLRRGSRGGKDRGAYPEVTISL